MRKDYEFINRAESVTGALELLPGYLREYGVTNAMIICGPVLERLGAANRVKTVIESAGVRARLIFSDVPNDGDSAKVKEIVDALILNNINGIVAIGGGSVIDTAKAVKYMCVDTSRIDKLLYGIDAIRRPLTDYVPLFAIPTTCGTGSEVTKVIVIKDGATGAKSELISSELIPEVSILTDEFLLSLPPKSAVFTAIDALTHAIEAYTSEESNPISDGYALTAAGIIGENLEAAASNSLLHKYNLLTASNMAGVAFSNAMVGLAHAIAHALGTVLGISHDAACAISLPQVMKFNADACKCKYERLGRAFGLGDERFAEYLERLIAAYGDMFNVPIRLKDYGANEEILNKIADTAYRDGARLTNPRIATRDDVWSIIQSLM